MTKGRYLSDGSLIISDSNDGCKRVECPDCDGLGYFDHSYCCGAPINSHCCTKCKDYADVDQCERCEGDGYIYIEHETETNY